MNEHKKLRVRLNGFFLLLSIIIPLNCCNRSKTGTEKLEAEQPVIQTEIEELETKEIRTGSLVNTLNGMIGYDYEKRAQLMTFINSILEHNGKSFYEEEAYGYYGVKYSYNTNGKYLFVTETEFGGGGSSFENTKTYIFDTELLILISPEKIFINANAPNPSFHKLVFDEYLLKDERFNQFSRDYLPNAEDSITDYGFSLFYAKDGIGLKWNKGVLAANGAGSFEIVLPYSKVQNFLTETGKEIFK